MAGRRSIAECQGEPDTVVVERMLSGWRLRAGYAEKEEALRRLQVLRDAWPDGRTGWHEDSREAWWAMRTPFWRSAALVAESMGTDIPGVLAELERYRERIARRARYARQKAETNALST